MAERRPLVVGTGGVPAEIPTGDTMPSATFGAQLAALASVAPAANQGIYWTGANSPTPYSLTAGGRALAGVAGTANTAPYFSASNTVSLQTVSASGRNLWNIGGTSGSMAFLIGANTWSLVATTSYGRGLLNLADVSAARDALGVALSGAVAIRTAALSIPNDSNTAVSFNTTDFDLGGWWSGLASTRLTVPSGVSLVKVSAGCFWTANATGQRLMRLFKNGAAVRGGFSDRRDATAALSTDMSCVSAVLSVTAGDYFELIAHQNSGAALNLLDSGTGTWMCIEAIPD